MRVYLVMLLKWLRPFFAIVRNNRNHHPTHNHHLTSKNCSNNVHISGNAVGNIFVLNQDNKSVQEDSVKLQKSDSPCRTPLTDRDVTRRGLVATLSIITCFVGLFADALGLFGSVGVDYVWSLPLYLLFIALFLYPNRDYFIIFWRRRAIKKCDTYVEAGRVAHFSPDGTFTIYKMTSQCIYPHCDGGHIEITTPSSENYGAPFLGLYPFVGKCSNYPEHTYVIDSNYTASRVRHLLYLSNN